MSHQFANLLRMLRTPSVIRRHHDAVRERIQHDALVRRMPALLTMPLGPTSIPHLAATLLADAGARVVLRGVPGSGRGLGLVQLAWHWSQSRRSAPLVLLPLAQIDQPSLLPYALLERSLLDCGLPMGSDAGGVPLPSWLLLIHEWERLDAGRRAAWRTFLRSLPYLWQQVRLVVSLPDDEEPWPGMRTIQLPQSSEGQARRCLEHLLPEQDLQPILAALAADGPLAPLAYRVREVVLLALVYPTLGVPCSRAHLYEQAAELLSQSDSVPTAVSKVPTLCPGDELLRVAHCARSIAESGAWETLAAVSDDERCEVARLLAGMLPDPTPLYRMLWEHEYLLTLAHCMREYPATAHEWGVWLLERLCKQPDAAASRAVLYVFDPVVPDVLVRHVRQHPPQAEHLLTTLAAHMSFASLLALLDNVALPVAMRWAVVDGMIAQHSTAALVDVEPPDDEALVMRAVALALGGNVERLLLAEPERAAWLAVLREPGGDMLRRRAAARALFSDTALPAALRIDMLNVLTDTPHAAIGLIRGALRDPDARVRAAAWDYLRGSLDGLNACMPLLRALLLGSEQSWEAQQDALNVLASFRQKEASVLLLEVALCCNLPLVGRIRALRALAARTHAGPLLLQRLLTMPKAHPLVQAAAVQLLAHIGAVRALDSVGTLLEGSDHRLVQQQAVLALGNLGWRYRQSAPVALAAVLLLLDASGGDAMLKSAIVQALGLLDATAAVSVVRAILVGDMEGDLRAAWLRQEPRLATLPPEEWETLPLSDHQRAALLSVLTEGTAAGEQPGSFDELLRTMAAGVRMVAAEVLARIGQQAGSAMRDACRAVLFDGLATPYRPLAPREARHLLACLHALSSDEGVSELEHLLAQPQLDPAIRWLVIKHYGASAATTATLLHYLAHPLLDTFARAAIARTLGSHPAAAVLPTLRALALQQDAHPHLRQSAAIALGTIDAPAALETLHTLIKSEDEPLVVRSAAATALPDTLPEDVRQHLRSLLRDQRPPTELTEALLRVLGRSRDQEAMPLLLHYLQSDQPSIVHAVFDALADLGDTGVAPRLQLLVHNRVVDATLRLHAVLTLLHLGGEEHMPLLQPYLTSDVLPLRLRALDVVLAHYPHHVRPLALVTGRSLPLALRLRALEALIAAEEHAALPLNLLRDESEPPRFRVALMEACQHAPTPDLVATLETLAKHDDSHMLVQRRAVDALEHIASGESPSSTPALLALSRLAEATAPEIWTWAAEALLHLLLPPLRVPTEAHARRST